MNKKRFRAFGLAVLFALSSVFPVRQANAFAQLVGLTVAAFGPGGTLLSADLLVSGVSAFIGGSIVALAITPNNADAPVRVPLSSDQAIIDGVMPLPSAPATAQSGSQLLWTGSCPGSPVATNQSSKESACSAAGGAVSLYQGSYAGCYSANGVCSVNGSNVTTCPSGYTLGQGGCALTNPRQAVSDGKSDITRSGSGFSPSADADPLPAYAAVANNKVYASGKDSSGRPVMIEYSVSADGTKNYITHYTQMEDSTQSTVKTSTITVDAATGAVTSASAGSAVGSVSPATGANAVPTVSTGAAVTSGTGTQQQTLTLPTDYARAGEAAGAASSINNKLDILHKDLTEKGVDVPDPVAPEASAFTNAFFNGTFGNLLAWRLPAHTSECPTVTFDYMMFSSHQVHHMNAQCTIAEQIRPALSVVMVVVWTIVAMFVLLEA